MAQTVSFRAGDELADAIEAERDKVEEETGYRPDRSKVVRRKLEAQLIDESEQEMGAA